MAAAAVVLAVLVGLSPVTVERRVHRAAPCPEGMTVRVIHRYGDVAVTGQPTDSVTLVAVIRATAEDPEVAQLLADSMIDVLLGRRGETLFVTTRYPRDLEPGPDLSYDVRLGLAVPGTAFVLATSSFGDLSVCDLRGGCRLDSRFGNVDIEGARDCEVTSRYGDVHVARSDGELAVQSSYGDVVLDEVSDRVTVDNRYGNLESDGASGVVYLDNRLGRVTARRSSGRMMVVNRFGDVEAWVDDSGLAELDVMAELGRVEINLAQRIPWQLGGRTVRGLIESALPLEVRVHAEGREVTGGQGTGGPRIGLVGSWADFFIRSVKPGEATPDE